MPSAPASVQLWSRREDKRNVKLSAIGSADNKTGYVFGMQVYSDYTMYGHFFYLHRLFGGADTH